jgi:hypothetical protein
VTQELLDELGVDALAEQQRRAGVPEVVEADRLEPVSKRPLHQQQA